MGKKNFFLIWEVVLLKRHTRKMRTLSLPNWKWHLNLISIFLNVREALRHFLFHSPALRRVFSLFQRQCCQYLQFTGAFTRQLICLKGLGSPVQTKKLLRAFSSGRKKRSLFTHNFGFFEMLSVPFKT